MGMYIKYTLILCDLFSFEVHTYDVPLICADVFGDAYLTGPCEREKIFYGWMNHVWKLYIEENYEIIAYLNFQFSFA